VPPGRKTKLTPKLERRLCAWIAKGATDKEASYKCDIDPSTLYDWIRWGEEGKPGPFGGFVFAIEKAKAARALWYKVAIGAHAKKDFRAVAYLAERSHPEQFVPQLRLHVTTEINAALDRLTAAFADDPQNLERALHAISGGTGRAPAAVAEGREDRENDPGGEAVHAPPSEPKATGVP
jgi:hypothetical protein